MHPLRTLLDSAAIGRFPAVDGVVEVHGPERSGHLAVVEFTGHSVVLADGPTEIVRAEIEALGGDGFGGASHPDVTRHLAGRRASIGTHDAMLVSTGGGLDPDDVGLVERHDLESHERVVRSRRHRLDVRVFGDEVGLITIGVGLVGRLEMSVELLGESMPGSGRRLIERGLAIAPAEPIWAQVAPGNAASLRAFLACGFTPIGAETLITR
ncbi:MAG: hypothetical protein AB8G26_12845 [Ilumatobacter sp.]